MLWYGFAHPHHRTIEFDPEKQADDLQIPVFVSRKGLWVRPYAFVTLFKMMDDRSISRKAILDYIEKAFPSSPRAGKMGEAIRYIEDHASSIDFDALLHYLKGGNPHE